MDIQPGRVIGNILLLVLALMWLYHQRDWEPLIIVVGFILTLFYQLLAFVKESPFAKAPVNGLGRSGITYSLRNLFLTRILMPSTMYSSECSGQILQVLRCCATS